MESAEYIRKLREVADIPQYELAARLGMMQSQLSDWERGKRKLSDEDVARVERTIETLLVERNKQIAEVQKEGK